MDTRIFDMRATIWESSNTVKTMKVKTSLLISRYIQLLLVILWVQISHIVRKYYMCFCSLCS